MLYLLKNLLLHYTLNLKSYKKVDFLGIKETKFIKKELQYAKKI